MHAVPRWLGQCRMQLLPYFSRRVYGIDILRGICCVLVMLRHHNGHYPASWQKDRHIDPGFQGMLRDPFSVWLKDSGWVGVDIFFVLSGFLVCGQLIPNNTSSNSDSNSSLTSSHVDTRTFLIRRGLRIYPIHYIYVILAILGVLFSETWAALTPHRVFGEVFFLQNMIGDSNGLQGSLQGLTWSLAVEEQFYLILPLLMSVSGAYFPYAAVGIVLTAAVNRLLLVFVWGPEFVGWRGPHEYKTLHYHGTFCRIDGMMIGCLLVWLSIVHKKQFKRYFEHAWTGVLGAVVLAGSVSLCRMSKDYYQPAAGYLVNSLAACFVVASMNTVKQISNRFLYIALSPIAFMGFYSYAVYLFHMFFRTAISYLSVHKEYISNELALVLYFAAMSLAFGWLVTAVVEAPVSRLRALFVFAKPSFSEPHSSNSSPRDVDQKIEQNVPAD